VRLTAGAGLEVGEDLVDHRRLGDERDDPHRPAFRFTGLARTRRAEHIPTISVDETAFLANYTQTGWIRVDKLMFALSLTCLLE
jgi:hypothetical protein